MKVAVVRILVHCVLPLLLGFLIYYFFRPDVAVVRCISHREPLIPFHEMNGLQSVLIYSGPDFCWSYSLAAALFTWESGLRKRIRFFPLTVLVLLCLSEVLQGVLLHHFTFDWIDLGAAVFAFILSFVLTHQRHE